MEHERTDATIPPEPERDVESFTDLTWLACLECVRGEVVDQVAAPVVDVDDQHGVAGWLDLWDGVHEVGRVDAAGPESEVDAAGREYVTSWRPDGPYSGPSVEEALQGNTGRNRNRRAEGCRRYREAS